MKRRIAMNSKLRNTSSVVIALVLVSAFAQSFVGDAAARPNRNGFLIKAESIVFNVNNRDLLANVDKSFRGAVAFHRKPSC
jgi:hypothetical protein